MFRKLFLFLFSCFLVTTIFARPRKVDSLEYIIAKHTEAMGGKKNLEAIKTITRVRGSGNMVTISQLSPFRGIAVMMFDTSKWRLRYAEGSNEEYYWEEAGEGAGRKIIKGRPDTAMWQTKRNPANLFLPLYKTREFGSKLTYLGRSVINNIPYYEIELTLTNGASSYWFINPTTFLIERNRGRRRLHAFEEHIRNIETVYKDFRKVNGVPVSFIEAEQDIDTGEILSGGKPSISVEFNLVFDPKDMGLEGNGERWKNYLRDHVRK